MTVKIMDTPPRTENGATLPNPPAAGFNQQLEELVKQAETAQNAPYKMLAIAKAMALIYKWNGDQGGTPQTWDKEPDGELRRSIMNRLIDAAARSMAEFSVTVDAEPEVKTLSQPWQDIPLPGDDGSLKPESLSPGTVLAAAGASQKVKGRKGSLLRAGGTVAGNHRAMEFINLLYRSYGLTRDQLRFLADFSKPLGAAAQHETSETIRLLEAAKMVSTRECDTWKNSQAEIYALTALGQHFYSLIHQREHGMFEPRSPYQLDVGLQQLYGLNQILASLAGSCRVASGAARIEELIAKQKIKSDWYNPQGNNQLIRLDWKPHGFGIAYGEHMRSVYPGQLGRIVVEERQLVPALMTEGNLAGERPMFSLARADGTAILPFVVEYDETGSQESFERFASKITAYVDLYNQPRYWQDYWHGRFPLILIVTSGTPRHMLEMMNATREHLRRLFKPKYPSDWWFTTTDWFLSAYHDYIGTFNNRRKPRPTCPRPEYAPLYPAQRGHIWLPISALGASPRDDTYTAVDALNVLITSDKLEEKEQAGQGLYRAGHSAWLNRLVGLPVPF
jgi:hypothetical protein